MQKICYYYLLALSEFAAIGTAAFAISMATLLLPTPYALPYILAGAVMVGLIRSMVRHYRYGITPAKQVKKYWMRPTETCIYELGVGSAGCVFAAALSGGEVFLTAFCLVLIGSALIWFWHSRGALDLSVLQ